MSSDEYMSVFQTRHTLRGADAGGQARRDRDVQKRRLIISANVLDFPASSSYNGANLYSTRCGVLRNCIRRSYQKEL